MNVASPFKISEEDLKTAKGSGNIKAVGAFLGKQGHQYVTISCGRGSKLPSSYLPPSPHCCSDTMQILWHPHRPPARGPIDIYLPQRHPPYSAPPRPPDLCASCALCQFRSFPSPAKPPQTPRCGPRSCIPGPSTVSFLLDPMFYLSGARLGTHKGLSSMCCTQNIKRRVFH
jgi:hypothetical protein